MRMLIGFFIIAFLSTNAIAREELWLSGVVDSVTKITQGDDSSINVVSNNLDAITIEINSKSYTLSANGQLNIPTEELQIGINIVSITSN